MSPASVVTMTGPVRFSHHFSQTVVFGRSTSSLDPTATAILVALASSLHQGDSVTVSGYAEKDFPLAKSRAITVRSYLEHLVSVRVRLAVVTSASTNVVIINVERK
jgi:outer membrane protein OmpA-like peptidoglycan-associated protein